ncbi:MAG: hypothetical protein OXH13_12410 [Chloroflexi bacterium]|nr:hypothetical protein [Chloroflexota bacterium]MCY3695737.1 hypothetical protein [Chloroflexota bacterium]
MGNHATPTAAYWAFFEHFNAQDPHGWAGAMSYPHVRVSAAPAQVRNDQPGARTASGVYSSEADYAAMAAEAGWRRFEATGWVRTQGITPRVVHSSADKVHLAGGWTRHRADDSEIITNRVLYVMTRTAEGWGIQARFGVDGFNRGAERSTESEAALAALARLMQTLEAGDVDNWLNCFHYPLTLVGAPGDVNTMNDAEEMRAAFGDWAGQALPINYTVDVLAAGVSGVTLAQSITRGDDSFRQAFLVADRDGEWKILAVSAIR